MVDPNRLTASALHIVAGCNEGLRSSTAEVSEASRESIIALLLAADGIDVNSTNDETNDFEDGWHRTPLQWAVYSSRVGCVRALLAADGLDVNYPYTLGTGKNASKGEAHQSGSALDGAGVLLGYYTPDRHCRFTGAERARYGKVADVVRLLACHHATHINRFDTDHYPKKQTALHYSCAAVDASLATDLLLAGACRFARDGDGRTPLERARKAMCARVRRSDQPLAYPRIRSQAFKGEIPSDCGCASQGAGSHAAMAEAALQELEAVFLSGIDYWQLRYHSRRARAMQEVVHTLLLVDQRLDANAALLAPGVPAVLPYLPKDLWLVAAGFLRSADFGPAKVWERDRPTVAVGARVVVKGRGPGTVRFSGKHHGVKDPRPCWHGVELDRPNGANNGTVEGHCYFTCQQGHGILVKTFNVQAIA